MTLLRNFCSALALMIGLVATVAYGQDAGNILDQLQKKYDSIRDASFAFTQRVQFGVMKSESVFMGKFMMKKGNKYRIEMEDQTIVTDGMSLWSYSKANNQVIVDKYKENPKSFTPDKVLMNVPNTYGATVLGKTMIGSEEAVILKLVPRDVKSNVKWMKVWVDQDEWLMRKVQLLDVSDNLTTYTISDVSLNANIDDAQFRFLPPKGTEVIDLR